MKKVQNKQNAILESAQTLVLEKGFAATSLDEICAKAGVTKGSFFHYFENKEQLGLQLVDRFAQAMGESVMARVGCCGPDPLDRVLGYIDVAVERCTAPGAKGCLIGTMTQELHATHPQITGCCGQKLEAMRDAFRHDLEAAGAKYGTNGEVDFAGLADLFITTVQGGFILMKATQDLRTMVRAMEQYRCYVKSLFKKR